MKCRIPSRHSIVYFLWLVSAAMFLNGAACSAEEQERYPFVAGEVILIPVEVFGGKHSFALDTGCSNTVLDIVFRGRFANVDVPTKLETRHGAFESFPAPAMTIGTVAPQSFQSSRDTVCLDMSHLRSASEQNFHGILGMDFLKSHVLRINPDEGIAMLQNTVTAPPAHVETIRYTVGGCPRIMVSISEVGLRSVLVDTGLNGTIKLETRLFNELVRRKRIVLRDNIEAANIGGYERPRTGVLDVIALGPYQIGNVRVVEDKLINAIGCSFLERFDTELDFPNERAYFRPSSRLNQPDRENLLGFWPARVNGTVIVKSVEYESNAAKCGICNGDELLEINERAVSKMTPHGMFVTCSQPGAELKVTLRRNGETKKVTLQLPQQTNPFPMPEPVPLVKQSPESISVP